MHGCMGAATDKGAVVDAKSVHGLSGLRIVMRPYARCSNGIQMPLLS